MIHNQFGRRNLNKYQRAKLALRLKPAVAAKAKEKMTSTLVQNTAYPNLGKRDEEAYHTNEELAKTANIGRSTFAKVAKIEEKATPEAKQKLQPYQRAKLAMRLKPALESKAKENQGMRTDFFQISEKSYEPVNTTKEMAKAAGLRISIM